MKKWKLRRQECAEETKTQETQAHPKKAPTSFGLTCSPAVADHFEGPATCGHASFCISYLYRCIRLYLECRLPSIFYQVLLSGFDLVRCLVDIESIWKLKSFVANMETNNINIRSQLYLLVSTAYTKSHLSDNVLRSLSYSYGIRNP